jgi:hypothetical protein
MNVILLQHELNSINKEIGFNVDDKVALINTIE